MRSACWDGMYFEEGNNVDERFEHHNERNVKVPKLTSPGAWLRLSAVI